MESQPQQSSLRKWMRRLLMLLAIVVVCVVIFVLTMLVPVGDDDGSCTALVGPGTSVIERDPEDCDTPLGEP